MQLVAEDAPALHSRTNLDVQVFDASLIRLGHAMHTYMRRLRGVGLAAPQIGIGQRIAVIEVDSTSLTLVNPVVTPLDALPLDATALEGCLSLPDLLVPVRRFTRVLVQYYDSTGLFHTLHASGPLAIAIQHEVDHLNGLLITDRVKELT